MRPSSWKDDRMPEMLWTVLLISKLKREEALEIFRNVATFVQYHPEFSDITLSGIASWLKEKRIEFVKLLSESHSEASKIPCPLVAFVHLPALDEWVEVLGNATDEGEVAGCKDVYDAYYDWTSSFSHGNWGAIRESNFAMCANPLHRVHLIPSVSVYPLPGVLEDVVKIANKIFSMIDKQYP